MKLYAVNRPRPVTKAPDVALHACAPLRLSSAGRPCSATMSEQVPRREERSRNPGEYTAAVVLEVVRSCRHRHTRAHDLPPNTAPIA
jgi:hypothetical protein